MSLSLGMKNGDRGTSTTNTLDLNELWSGLRSSDKQALSQLFSVSYSWLFKYGYQIVPNRPLVKDAIQELFLTLWSKRNTIDKARSVMSYLLISLRRMIFRKIRKQKNRSERNFSYTQNSFGETEHIEESIIKNSKKNS